MGDTLQDVLVQRDAALAELERERATRREKEAAITELREFIDKVQAELKKITETSLQLVEHLNTRQAEGDRLRRRLGKLIDAYEALKNLHNGVVAGVSDLDPLRSAWAKATLALETLDG